jgi:hypothetical protein
VIQEKSYYKRFTVTGPGGRSCRCCYPQSGPARRLFERADGKTERQWFKKLIEESLKSGD